MNTLEYMGRHGHEQVAFWSDPSVGLRAIIAIHDTTLGPSLGGCRIWPHRTEEEALEDVLRLSRAMTYKNAAAGLHLGGGKALIWADAATQKTEAMMRAFGRFVHSLDGRYITAEDVGATLQDMEWVRQETPYVTGLPTAMGGSGDTSIMTGLGVYMGMKAAAKAAWGTDSLAGKRIAVQGYGKVATYLVGHLVKEEVDLLVSEINPVARDRARAMGAGIVAPEEILGQECDILSPCALGGVLNPSTVPQLKCRVVAGGANNQLLTLEDGDALHKRGIVYAPDYIINAGGVINVSCEIGMTYNEARAREKTLGIYETMERVLRMSKREDISTARAADRLAEERIASARAIRRTWKGA